MYRRNDPRFRRTLNEISQTLETANESAQANIFSFSHNYINPCFNGVYSCFQPCVEHCFSPRDQRTGRVRGRSQGRAELSFDFYDDWDEEENDGLLGWGSDEHEGLLGTSGGYGTNVQPGRPRGMSYGTGRDTRGRRKSIGLPPDGGLDPTVVPASSFFGLFGRFTGKLGQKNLRYKPSAADLQEHPGAAKKFPGTEGEPLLEEDEEDDAPRRKKKHGRTRSGTATSGETTDSFSSRGDIFPSEDEDDAVPLDDEFAMVLERRTTNSGLDESSSGRTRGSPRPGPGSRRSTRTASSRATRKSSYRSSRGNSKSPSRTDEIVERIESDAVVVASLTELKAEEERAQAEEEAAIEMKRVAAQRLAMKSGLSVSEPPDSPSSTDILEATVPVQQGQDDPFVSPITQNLPETGAVPFPDHEQPSEDEVQSSQTDPPINDEGSTNKATSPTFIPAQLPRFYG